MNNALILIIVGTGIVIVGLILYFFSNSNFPFLPGDIYFKSKNITIYFPIVSSIVISFIISIILKYFNK